MDKFRKDRKRVMPKLRYIQDISEARALAYYLSKESLRHESDIQRARVELLALEELWGVEQPEVDGEEWVEVRTKTGGDTHDDG